MIKCICIRMCQHRMAGRAVTFSVGEVMEFEKCPEYFEPLGKGLEDNVTTEGYVDYDAVSRDELVEADGNLEDLKSFLGEKYPDIRFSSNIGYDTLLFRYLEARENKETTIDNTGKTKNTIVEVRSQLDTGEEETPDSDIDTLDSLLGE